MQTQPEAAPGIIATAEARRGAATSATALHWGAIWFLIVITMSWAGCSSDSDHEATTSVQPTVQPPPTRPDAGSQSADVPQTKLNAKPVLVVVQKLYIDAPDIEGIIGANLRIEAANYGFELVDSRAEADIVLEGSAGVMKKEGFPFDSCMPFYYFEVVGRRSAYKEASRLRLSSGFPNEIPCVRLIVARRILANLREGLNKLGADRGR